MPRRGHEVRSQRYNLFHCCDGLSEFSRYNRHTNFDFSLESGPLYFQACEEAGGKGVVDVSFSRRSFLEEIPFIITIDISKHIEKMLIFQYFNRWMIIKIVNKLYPNYILK